MTSTDLTEDVRRTQRLVARITDEQKRLVQRAADVEGRSVSELVVMAVQAAAIRTVREHTLRIGPLESSYDRPGFTCGQASLDNYLHRRIDQDAKRRLAAPFVATDAGGGKVLGSYTLAAESIRLATLPADIDLYWDD